MILGLVGPSDSCKMIQTSIESIDPAQEVKCYTREMVCQSTEVIAACEKECDAIIFTGCAISSYVLDHTQVKKPNTFISRSVVSISEAFVRMQQQGLSLDEFSIDVVEQQVLEDILDGFHIQAKSVYVCPFQAGVSEEAYVEWHENLQKEDKTRIALTSFAAVYYMLRERGRTVIYLEPKRSVIRDALNVIHKEMALAKAEDSQIAVEIIQMSNYEEKAETYYSVMASKAEFERAMIDYVRKVQGALFPLGRDEYVIFANTGALRRTWNYQQLSQLQKQGANMGLTINVGIGMGSTAYRAETNARKALDTAIKKKKGEIYQIDERNLLKGPLGKEQLLQYSKISFDPGIQAVAQKTGLNTDSISKIIAIAEVRKSYIFDAAQLAECLEVTPRSARRILNKLVSAGYADICAKENAAFGGRPKSLFEIKIVRQ